MNLESKFKVKLVEQCRARGAMARRHEDRFAVGLLDLAIKFPSHPHLLAEAKLVQHQSYAPTKLQFLEGEKWQAAGTLCALIGYDPLTRVMYIHEWAEEAKRATSFTERGDYASVLLAWLTWRTK